MPFGCLLDTFWMPFGPQDVPGPHFGDFMNFRHFGNIPGAKKSPLFEAILVPRATFWRSVSCRFFGYPLVIFFVGGHLAWFLGCLGTLEIKLKRWRGCQNHTFGRLVLQVGFLGMNARLCFSRVVDV